MNLSEAAATTRIDRPEPGRSRGKSMLITDDFVQEVSKRMSTQTAFEFDFLDSKSVCNEIVPRSPHDAAWLSQSDHVFVLSTSGKPIYTLHGNEMQLAGLFGVMLALVSVVQMENNDIIQSVQAAGLQIVFLVRPPLILVAASKSRLSVQQIQMELTVVYNQILSLLTLSRLTETFKRLPNYDLRHLLGDSGTRLISNLLLHRTQRTSTPPHHLAPTPPISNKPFTFLTNSVRILPLSSTIRASITSTIRSGCAKIKHLMFAVLVANDDRLITLVRKKKHFLHPADLRLMFNLLECCCGPDCSQAEQCTPICLPMFNADVFLFAHVSHLAEDCSRARMLLFTVDPSQAAFFALAEAKRKISERLRRTKCLIAIREAMRRSVGNLRTIGIPEMRHFVYKSRSNAQLVCAEIGLPYAQCVAQFGRLERLYYGIHQRMHNGSRPLKMLFEAGEREVMLGWMTSGYELYVAIEPLVSKEVIIRLVKNKLLAWIKSEEDALFIRNAPTF